VVSFVNIYFTIQVLRNVRLHNSNYNKLQFDKR